MKNIVFLFLCIPVFMKAQQNGIYVTMDFKHEVHFLDSNQMILISDANLFTLVEQKGEYQRKGRKIYFYPNNAQEVSELYVIKNVWGDHFMLRKKEDEAEFKTYFLKKHLKRGIN